MRRDGGLLLAACVAAAAVSLVASASSAYRVVGDLRLWGSATPHTPAVERTPTAGASRGPAAAGGTAPALDAGSMAWMASVAALVVIVVVLVALARRVRPAPPGGVVMWTLVAAATVLAATTGSEWVTIGAVAAAVIALAWLHVVLVALVDPLPPRAPYAPAAIAVASSARVGSLRSELDRAIGRPQYDGSVRPRLAELARERLGRHGIDPDIPAGRAAAVARLGEANCAYLFPVGDPGAPLDPARLDAVLTALEDL